MTRNKATNIQTYEVKWVTIEKYSELVGLTKDSINSMRSKGKLLFDIHWKKSHGRIFINIETTQALIDKS
jgi:hypothetical protein